MLCYQLDNNAYIKISVIVNLLAKICDSWYDLGEIWPFKRILKSPQIDWLVAVVLLEYYSDEWKTP
jgi:hypothetical protein